VSIATCFYLSINYRYIGNINFNLIQHVSFRGAGVKKFFRAFYLALPLIVGEKKDPFLLDAWVPLVWILWPVGHLKTKIYNIQEYELYSSS
jgi:hypothetical protein